MADRAHSTSRRALLAAFATSTIVLPAAAGEAHPDAELLALGRDWERADAALTAADDRVNHLEIMLGKTPLPDAVLWREADEALGFSHFTALSAEGRRWYCVGPEDAPFRYTASDLRTLVGPKAAQRERAREITAAYDAWYEAKAAAERRIGLTAAQVESARLAKAEHAVLLAILRTQARTLAGLAVKARVAIKEFDDPQTEVEGLVAGLLCDLLEMQSAT